MVWGVGLSWHCDPLADFYPLSDEFTPETKRKKYQIDRIQ